jgi:hypothetical protein
VASRKLRGAIAVAAIVCAASPPVSAASLILGDRDVPNPTLQVNGRGVALVGYTTKAGLHRHVLLRGAVNAVANPTVGSRQEAFSVDYSGGWKSQRNPHYWRTFNDACAPYDGPALPFFVAGCKAPDGSYWALQAWQRNLPVHGYPPWTEQQRAVELHVSHWSGELPVLEIIRHWTYGDAQQGFFGRLTYLGRPVYGLKTASASTVDPFARNISIDAYNSDFGPGWRHDTAISTHKRNGGFCYSFVPQAPPDGYPGTKPRGTGLGREYRVSVIGPGVMPIIQWVGKRLTRFSAAEQLAATRRFDAILGGDRHCAPER